MSIDPTVVELTAADFARFGLDPATEDLLAPCTVTAVRDAFARWLGVTAAGVIAFPFASLPPVPKPGPHRADGRQRLPPTITRPGAGHPVWWLDAHTAWQDPGEDDLAYGVRLALEVTRRGLTVPGDGPVDLLATRLGWPVGDPRTEARVAAYAQGGWDADLCRLELGPLPHGSPNRHERQRAACDFLAPRSALLAVLDGRLVQARAATVRADLDRAAGLAGAVETLADRVEQAGRDLRAGACRQAGHTELMAARQRLAEAVDALVDRLAEHAGVCRRILPSDADSLPPEDAAVIVGSIYRRPDDDAGYRALHDHVEARRRGVAARMAQARDSLSRPGRAAALPASADRPCDLGAIPPLPDAPAR